MDLLYHFQAEKSIGSALVFNSQRPAANPNGRGAQLPCLDDTRTWNRWRPILFSLAWGPRPHAFRLSDLVFAAQAAPSIAFIFSSFHVIIFFLQLIPPVTFPASLSKSNAKCRMMARFSAPYPVLVAVAVGSRNHCAKGVIYFHPPLDKRHEAMLRIAVSQHSATSIQRPVLTHTTLAAGCWLMNTQALSAKRVRPTTSSTITMRSTS